MTRALHYTIFAAVALLMLSCAAQANYWVVYIYGRHAPYPAGMASLSSATMTFNSGIAQWLRDEENHALASSDNLYVNDCHFDIFQASDEKNLRSVLHHQGHPIWPEGLEHWVGPGERAMMAEKGKNP